MGCTFLQELGHHGNHEVEKLLGRKLAELSAGKNFAENLLNPSPLGQDDDILMQEVSGG